MTGHQVDSLEEESSGFFSTKACPTKKLWTPVGALVTPASYS